MVSADLEGLVSAHHQPGLVVLLVPQQPHVASTTLLPFLGVTVESEQLGAHLEGLLLEFFIGLGVDLFSQANDRLEVNFRGFGSLLLKKNRLAHIQSIYNINCAQKTKISKKINLIQKNPSPR